MHKTTGAIAGLELTSGAAQPERLLLAPGIAGDVVAVETASLAAGCFFALIPFLP